jgi:large subunit ribosomal protein L15
MPLSRRLPKVGFVNLFAQDLAEVSVGRLDVFAAGETVDEKALRAKGLIKGKHDGFKVLGNGSLTKKLTVRAEAFSAGAKQKIEGAGGTCEVVERKVAPVVRHKKKKK